MTEFTIRRVFFDAVGRSGSRIEIEVRLLSDLVEVWRSGECLAFFDRDHFRTWLNNPAEPIGMGDVEFTLDRYVDLDGRIAISTTDLTAWTLSPQVVQQLEVWGS